MHLPQTEQWWQRGGFIWLHFLQYRILEYEGSFRFICGCKPNPGPPNSEDVKGRVSPLSSSVLALQFGGTPPGSVNTTAK